jgi:hypothetical protein
MSRGYERNWRAPDAETIDVGDQIDHVPFPVYVASYHLGE